MEKTEELIVRTEQLLQQMASLQAALQSLSAELQEHCQDLLERLGKSPRKPTQRLHPLMSPERRSAPRRRGNPISVQISNSAADEETMQGWVVDRSTGGIRLLVDEAVELGTVLNVRPAKVHANYPWIKVKVKSCHPERMSWNLGCQFVEKITWEDLQQFG